MKVLAIGGVVSLVGLISGGVVGYTDAKEDIRENKTNIEQQQKQFNKIDEKLEKIYDYLLSNKGVQ